MNSPVRPTDPTEIVGAPVTFLAHPAKFQIGAIELRLPEAPL
jgi:hypothetical protein